MKFSKLNENKIKIFLNQDDFIKKNIDIETFMSRNSKANSFFLDILNTAEKELGFETDGCKLLIESITSNNICVLTVTKYREKVDIQKDIYSAKNTKKNTSLKSAVNYLSFKFSSFDTFCEFCEFLVSQSVYSEKLCIHSSLYLYKDTYYLILKNSGDFFKINKNILQSLNEFSLMHISTEKYIRKIFEFGTPIIKTNALNIGIKYFSSKKKQSTFY